MRPGILWNHSSKVLSMINDNDKVGLLYPAVSEVGVLGVFFLFVFLGVFLPKVGLSPTYSFSSLRPCKRLLPSVYPPTGVSSDMSRGAVESWVVGVASGGVATGSAATVPPLYLVRPCVDTSSPALHLAARHPRAPRLAGVSWD